MSNKNVKKKIREEKKQAGQRKAKLSGMLLKGFAAVMVMLAIYVFAQGLFGGAAILAPNQISESDHVRGTENAPLTITLYADFQCPSCLTETELVATVWPRIADKTRLVFRHFPLDTHRHSFLAARYAEAASRQGQFWSMHDLLFANQRLWSDLEDVSQIFNGYALELGLDMDRLILDIDATDVSQKIIADQQGGLKAGVRGTPVMFFNGRRVNNPRSASELLTMVKEALEDIPSGA